MTKKMDLEQMTIAEAREMIPQARALLSMFRESPPGAAHSTGQDVALPYPVGTNVYIRGAIYSITGRLEEARGQWLILSSAAYVGTDGRFSKATVEGIQNVDGAEIEPVGSGGMIAVNSGAISDVCIHPGELPRETL